VTDAAEVTSEAQPTVEQGRSFDAWAAEYDRYRPGYPDHLFTLIAQELGLGSVPTAVDLGAGTGKATLVMAALGWQVTAIEPGAKMLDALRAAATSRGLSVQTREASAESTGLPDAAFDVATAAQAFHWFRQPDAVREIARIVRPGGGVAVFWNVRDDERSAFVAAYADLLRQHVPERYLEERVQRRGENTREQLSDGGYFEVGEKREPTHEITMSSERFLGMAFTASYVQTALDQVQRDAFRAALSDLIDEHAVDGHVLVPYRIDLWIGRRTAVAVRAEPAPG
jgi:SAM-dependent methyltransferase